MGFALNWLAVRGLTPEESLRRLNLKGTGEIVDYAYSRAAAATLSNGWFLILDEHVALSLVEDAKLAPLSAGCECITCEIEDHVMFSRACGWSSGTRQWAVTHNSDLGIQHLSIEGDPPNSFYEIRTRLQLAQDAIPKPAGVDFIYDIPIDLAESQTGFRHNHEYTPAIQFELLAPLKRPSIFQRLFRF